MVSFRQARGHLQGVFLIAVPEESAGVAVHEAEHAEGSPLDNVGQFMGQERFGQTDSPFYQDHLPPYLGPGPGGKEPGDIKDFNGDVRRGRQVGLSQSGLIFAGSARPTEFAFTTLSFPGASGGREDT